MFEFHFPGELNVSDIEKFLREAHGYYPYLFDLSNLNPWADKLAKHARCICIRNDGAIRAACLYYCNQQTKTAYITLIVVFPDSKHGSGYELFSRCLCDSRNSGMNKIQLEVLKSNTHALQFYTRQGFVAVDEHNDKMLMELQIL